MSAQEAYGAPWESPSTPAAKNAAKRAIKIAKFFIRISSMAVAEQRLNEACDSQTCARLTPLNFP